MELRVEAIEVKAGGLGVGRQGGKRHEARGFTASFQSHGMHVRDGTEEPKVSHQGLAENGGDARNGSNSIDAFAPAVDTPFPCLNSWLGCPISMVKRRLLELGITKIPVTSSFIVPYALQ